MKRILALFLLIASTLTIAETNNMSASADLSPAGRSIAEARKAIEKGPSNRKDCLILKVLGVMKPGADGESVR